jgi:hypothetical protein
MLRIARIFVFVGLCLEGIGSLIWYWRNGRSGAIADLGVLALLLVLMVRNPSRWVHAVGFFAVLAVLRTMAEWLLLPQSHGQLIQFKLLLAVVFALAPLYLIIAQRRRAQASVGQIAYGKLLLGSFLILTTGILSQVTWRIWHALYFVPMAMMDGVPPQWQMWLIDVSLDWQMNYGLWTFLLALALIAVMGAQDRAKLFSVRLYLASYLSLIVAVSVGYLVVS